MTPRFGRWALLAAALPVLAAGAAVGWWWYNAAPPPAPPMPRDIEESEVREAIEAARAGVLQEPYSAGAWGRLGMMLLAHLFSEDADRCFAEAARLDPSDARWPYARALIALKRDPDNAVPLLRQAAKGAADAWPDDPSAVPLQLAEALLERGQLDEAEGIFRESLRRKPGDARAELGLGLAAAARGDAQAAGEHLTAARSDPHARKKATVQLAALARARGDPKAADDLDREAAALPDDPPWPDPLLDQVVQLQVGHRGRERREAELEQQRRYAEAAQAYLEEVQERPTARACIGAGLNLARDKQYDQAFPLLRQAVRLDPNSAQAHYTLALALFSRAEETEQQSPTDQEKKEIRDWFQEASGEARRATELRPDHAQAYDFWGLALMHLGDSAGAVAPLRQGVECRPENLELQLHLGEALMASGQAKEAETHLENARRLAPAGDSRAADDLKRLRMKP